MKKRLIPLIALLALACAAALLFAGAVLTGRWPPARSPHHPQLVVVELDDRWAADLAALPTTQAMKEEIAQTVAQVKGWGGNAVTLTGCVPGGEALFRDRTGTLSTVAAVTQGDRFLSRFDPVQWLVRRAREAGVEVCLTAAPEPWCADLADRYGLRLLTAAPTGYRLEDGAAVLRADGSPGVLAGAVQRGETRHVCLGSLTALRADDSDAVLYTAFAQSDLPDLTAVQGGKTIAQTLAVSYPTASGSTVYTSRVFLMGTSDPAQPLTLNGAGVERGNADGVWGVLVELEPGENAFTLQNGAQALQYTVKRGRTGSGSGGKLPNDTTRPAVAGQYLRITDAIASALTDPAHSDTIRQTLYQNAVAEVVASARYSTGSKMTYAYQLSTGDWIRSSACQLLEQGSDALLAAPQIAWDSAARSTVLTFAGGTPAVYHSWQGNTLALTFLSASLDGALPALPDWITGAAVEPGAGSFTLTLTFADTDPLYGWAVNYDPEANTTAIWLKRTPRLSGDPAAPLAGITVLLDPGHGGSDDGAMGAAGMQAPLEKDLNLAAATAAKHRLEQLGATVQMTRTGDEFPTLGDRVTALNEQHPDFFIAVHHNSVDLSVDVNEVWGTEAYWFYDEGEALANTLVEEVCAATGRRRRGAEYGYYYVTRSNICPAVLLELGFVTNPTEYAECATPQSLWADGSAIAEAVYRQVRNQTK